MFREEFFAHNSHIENDLFKLDDIILLKLTLFQSWDIYFLAFETLFKSKDVLTLWKKWSSI